MYRGQQFFEYSVGYFNNEQIQQQYKKGMREYSLFDMILREQNIQFIEINPIPHGFDRLILQTHIRFYCQSDSYIKNGSIEQIKGKCYKIKYDKNNNPSFPIEEGIFNIRLNKEEYHLLQEESMDHEMRLSQNKEDLRKQQEDIQQIQQQKRDRIIIMNENNQILKSKQYGEDGRVNQIYQKLWVKYNQQISERDETIIQSNSTQWVTSSLIDSLVEYLNKKSEEKINKYIFEKRIKIIRILLVPSCVTTSFGVCDDETTYIKKVQELLKQEFRCYKELNYDMKQVYGKIGFPININNMHWVFLVFDLRNKTITQYDSLKSIQKTSAKPGPICKAIAKFLNQNFEMCYQMNYEKQRDKFSCGYYVCSFMKFEYKLQFNKKEEYKFTQKQMKKKLRKLVSIE